MNKLSFYPKGHTMEHIKQIMDVFDGKENVEQLRTEIDLIVAEIEGA